MAIGGVESESRRVIVIEADDRDVKRAMAALERAEAAAQRKRDQHLVAQLAKQGEVTASMLTQARMLDELARKEAEVAKAAATIGLPFEETTKKTSQLRLGLDAVNKKVGEIGKTLGAMAVGFGIQQGLSIIGNLFAPPSPQEMDEFIAALHDAGGPLGYLAQQAKATRDFVKETEAALARRATMDQQRAAVLAKYDPASREKQLMADLYIIKTSGLTGDALDQAIHDTFQKYHQLADAASGAANATRRYVQAAKEAAKVPPPATPKERRLNAGGRDWKTIYQQGFTDGGIIPSSPDRKEGPGWYQGGLSDMSFSGDPGGTTGKMTEENLRLAESYGVVADAITNMSAAMAAGELNMAKVGIAGIATLMGGLREYALGKVKTNIAEGIEKWPLGMHHFAAAAAWSVAAGVLGGGMSRLGGGGGGGGYGGGGGGRGYSGASSAGGGGNSESTHTTTTVLSDAYMMADDATKERLAARMVRAGTRRKRTVRRG